VQAVIVRSLSHLARSLRHLTDLGCLFASQDVALIATEDLIDTTDPGGAIRWRDWLDISGRLNHALRAEAAKLARLRTPDGRWGRPEVVINPFELLAWWEGRGGRRPVSLRELACKLGVSEATARKRLRTLRAAGQVDDGARARALAARGGLRKGGRPANPLDDADLAAAWRTAPSVAVVARNLNVSRSRVQSRLRELGLTEEE
jgi:DNA invertase Pin-like site-specific DNA recombinase